MIDTRAELDAVVIALRKHAADTLALAERMQWVMDVLKNPDSMIAVPDTEDIDHFFERVESACPDIPKSTRARLLKALKEWGDVATVSDLRQKVKEWGVPSLKMRPRGKLSHTGTNSVWMRAAFLQDASIIALAEIIKTFRLDM